MKGGQGLDCPLETKSQEFAATVGMSLAFHSILRGSLSPVVREIRADYREVQRGQIIFLESHSW